jgi:hypothetical protein
MTQPTRVWWDNEEVKFIGWTDKALVFQWADPRETAIHMPRGAVVRLVDRGVLHIEGFVPVWMRPTEETSSLRSTDQTKANKPSQNNSRFSIVTRLIRKLSSDRNPETTRVTSD